MNEFDDDCGGEGGLKHKRSSKKRSEYSSDEAIESLEKAEASAKLEEKVKSHKLPEESVEQYFRRMSHIREMIWVCKQRKKQELGNLEPGSDGYYRAMKRFKEWAIPYATEQFHNRNEYHRFPAAVKQGIPWFDGLKSQFIEVTQRHHNVDLFANQVILQHDILQALFNFRRYAHYAPLVDLVAKSGLKWDEGMRPAIVLAGEKSCAKSYMLAAVSKMFFPGVFDDVTHRTAMSEMTSGQNDMLIRAMDETPAWMLGGGGAGAAEFEGSAANSAHKSLQTNKIGHTRTIDMSDGDRKTVDFYSSNIGTALYATNVRLPPASSPAMARLIVVSVDCIDPTNEDAIEKLLLKLQEPELEKVQNDALESRQLINFYVMLFELYIAMGICAPIQMDAWVIYFQRYCEKMQACGFVLSDPKKVVQITELARTMTLVYAIQIGLFSEISYNQRKVDPLNPESPYVKFWDTAPYFIDLVQRHCVCTRSITVYVMSLCRDMWANKLRLDILEAAHKATVSQFPSIFHPNCFDDDQTKRRVDRSARAFESSMGMTASDDTNMMNENSSMPTFEEDQITYDDYGCENDLDANELSPNEDGNYLREALKKGAAPQEICEREVQRRLNRGESSSSSSQSSTPTKRVRKEAAVSEMSGMEPDFVQQLPVSEINDGSSQTAALPAAVSGEKSPLDIFLTEFPNSDISKPLVNPNYVFLQGTHMSMDGTCELLSQQFKDGNRRSPNNIHTELRNMEECDITVPIYKLNIADKKVERTNQMHTIKMVRIEENTSRFDPNDSHGPRAVRVYIALHSILNNHSLTKAIIRSIRNLGFENSIPGRCIINIPVEAHRYAKDSDVPHGGENEVMTMYGINRVVRIVPINEPFIYVKNNTITREMLDILVGLRRGAETIHVSPSLLNCSHALWITCEPEIQAALQHAKVCGDEPDTPLYGTPVLLENTVAQIHLETPNLGNSKLYSYPRRKMDEYRLRYMVSDAHQNPASARKLRPWVASSTDASHPSTSGKRPVPEAEMLRVISATGTRAVVDFIASTVAVSRKDATFEQILQRFSDADLLRKRLLEIGLTEVEFMRSLRDLSLGFNSKRTVARFEIGNLFKQKRNVLEAKENASRLAAAAKGVACPQPPNALSFSADFDVLAKTISEISCSSTSSADTSDLPAPAAPAPAPSSVRIFDGIEKAMAGGEKEMRNKRMDFLFGSAKFVDLNPKSVQQ